MSEEKARSIEGGGEKIPSSEMNPHSSSNEHITFAKRRNLLMKKAKDLSQLWDAEVGIIIFSCTAQLYEYSSLSMDSVIERYNNLKREAQPELGWPPIDAKVLEEEIANLNRQLQGLQEYLRYLSVTTQEFPTIL